MDQHDEFRQLEWQIYKTNQEVRTSVVENLGELSVSGIDINIDSLITGISHGNQKRDAWAVNLLSGASMSKYDVEIKQDRFLIKNLKSH